MICKAEFAITTLFNTLKKFFLIRQIQESVVGLLFKTFFFVIFTYFAMQH